MGEDHRTLARPFPSKSIDFEKLVNSGRNAPVLTYIEAVAQGLNQYWTGEPCNKGHYALRNTKGRACSACIYLHNQHAKEEKKKRREAKKLAKEDGQVFLTNRDRNAVLAVFAKTGDMEEAARAINLTIDKLNVEIARDPNFYKAIDGMEKRLRKQGKFKVVAKTPEVPPASAYDYEWTEEKRLKFCRVYIDTGDIHTARASIEVTPSIYYEELDRNDDFRRMVEKAKPRAEQALEERGIQLALMGNDKLITLILKAKKPEYADKVKVEQNVKVSHDLTDEQLQNRIEQLAVKHNIGLIIDAEFNEVKREPIQVNEVGERGAISESRRIGTSKDV
jgi:hypothetical protein